MLPSMKHLLGISLSWTFVVTNLLMPAELQAFSFNPDDYEFGWFTVGLLDAGQLPTCTYCINALGDQAHTQKGYGPDWNRTVGLYRCDGVQTNEIWAYQNSTGSIVFSILNETLCLDAVLWESRLLTLRICNSSVVTQQWKYEGNSLINGLNDSNGQNLYLLAVPPDLGTNPSNQNYTYPLFISTSTPSDQFSYTSSFTFLPTTDLVSDRATDNFTTQGLLQISNSPEGQISNGGFENSTILAGTNIEQSFWNQSFPSYFALCGWVIDYGPIDYVKTGFLQPESGLYSIHLNTHTDVNHNGSISQTFRTDMGKEYNLSFYLTGFPPFLDVPGRPNWACNPTYPTEGANLQVQVADGTTTDTTPGPLSDTTANIIPQNFTVNVNGTLTATTIAASWTQKTVIFTASSNVTRISFISLNFNNSCGPMLDTVEVSILSPTKPPIPSPTDGNKVVAALGGSIGGLVGVIAILGILYGARKYGARDDYSGELYKTEHARVYSLKELTNATKKFSSVLGEGGFGTVYKAEFPDGTVRAVKVEKPRGLNSSSKVLALEEIAVLLRIHHRNLVNLTGFSVHRGQHMLVFEYLPNGSLYDRLHQSILPSPPTKSVELRRRDVIPWGQRVKIAADVASGLEYLHHEADPPIVHRDVKSSNILLTATDSAKLADFGLSKAAPENATTFQSIETVVKGSLGYMDPQYLVTGVFSPESDVYSFGVVLLEIISGHPAIYNADSLACWAAPYLGSPSLYHELVDKTLDGDFNEDELETLVNLSKMCMHEDGKMRPNMRQVVSFLYSKQLPSIREDSPQETMEEISTEGYQKIYEAMFVDFDSSDAPVKFL